MRWKALLAAALLGGALELPPGWTERDIRGNDAGLLYAAISADGRASLAILPKPDDCAPGMQEERIDNITSVVFRTLVTDDYLYFFTDETPDDDDWQSISEWIAP